MMKMLVNLSIGGFYRYRKGGEKHSFEGKFLFICFKAAVGRDSYATLYKKYSNFS